MTKLGLAPLIDPSAEISRSHFGTYTEVGARTKLLEVRLDDYSYVVNDSDIAYADIGKFCSIASHVRINPGDHPMERASQSHFTYRSSAYFENVEDDLAFFEWRRSRPVRIGHDVWIGHGVVVLSGRTIGTGAVVGAGTVVTRDIPDYAIVVGNPGRIVRYRFDAEVIEKLKGLRWWDWSHETLKSALDDFRHLNVNAFLNRYGA